MFQGHVAVSDLKGHVAFLGYDGSFLWKQKSEGEFGWMVCLTNLFSVISLATILGNQLISEKSEAETSL